MSIPVVTSDEAGAGGRGGLVDAAASALREGRLVVIPTETVYGLAGAVSLPASVDRLMALGGLKRAEEAVAAAGVRSGDGRGIGRDALPRPAAWHAPSVASVEAVLELQHPLHRRALHRLAPGPVSFFVQRDADGLRRATDRLGALPRTVDNGVELAVRVPDHSLAREILERAGLPVVAVRLSEGGWASAEAAAAALARLRGAEESVALIVDDGTTRHGKPSTAVRLLREGGVEVVSVGALEERQVRRRLERTILFVCTGNTCRSPMAEAIARDLLARSAGPGSVPTRVRSAGTAAGGDTTTPDSIEALRRLGIEVDAELGRRRSRGVDREAIGEADVIYAMTGTHARSVVGMDPSAAAKVHTIDPSGLDVPDPIGGTMAVYLSTAERLTHLIERRLKELDEQGA